MSERNVSGLVRYNKESNLITIEAIEVSIIKLMQENEYSTISISEICKVAGVSRMAFYNNYDSKDDILLSIVKKENEKLIARIGSPFKTKLTINWYINLFNSIEKNKTFLRLMFNANFKYRYLSTINELVLHSIDTITLEEKNKRLLWAGGIVNRIITWIEDDLKESVSELAEFCFKYFNNN